MLQLHAKIYTNMHSRALNTKNPLLEYLKNLWPAIVVTIVLGILTGVLANYILRCRDLEFQILRFQAEKRDLEKDLDELQRRYPAPQNKPGTLAMQQSPTPAAAVPAGPLTLEILRLQAENDHLGAEKRDLERDLNDLQRKYPAPESGPDTPAGPWILGLIRDQWFAIVLFGFGTLVSFGAGDYFYREGLKLKIVELQVELQAANDRLTAKKRSPEKDLNRLK